MAGNIQEQVDIAERLQLKVLKHFEKELDAGTISPTDMATLCRLMAQNGWRFDPHALPQGLRSKIMNLPNPLEFEEHELQ